MPRKTYKKRTKKLRRMKKLRRTKRKQRGGNKDWDYCKNHIYKDIDDRYGDGIRMENTLKLTDKYKERYPKNYLLMKSDTDRSKCGELFNKIKKILHDHRELASLDVTDILEKGENSRFVQSYPPNAETKPYIPLTGEEVNYNTQRLLRGEREREIERQIERRERDRGVDGDDDDNF